MAATGNIESRELETLLRVSRALTSSLDLPTVLQTAVTSAIEVLELDTGAIYTVESGSLFLGATTPELPPDFPLALRFAQLDDHPHLRECIESNELLDIKNLREVAKSAQERAVVEARSLVTVLYVPLSVDGHVHGALLLGTQHLVREFSPEQLRLCKTLAHQISLAVANSRLFEAVSDKNVQLKHAHQHMTEYIERLSAMTATLAVAERRERRRLAEELHDRVSQSLAVAKMTLERVVNDGCDGHEREFSAISSLVDDALAQTRAITEELSPAVLLQPGLAPALLAQCQHIEALYGLDVDAHIDGDNSEVSDDVKVFVYRAAHELLLNVVKHANSPVASLTVRHLRGALELVVRDEGIGLGPDASSAASDGGFGLLSIREQLVHLGGSLDVDGRDGGGTAVTIRLPL